MIDLRSDTLTLPSDEMRKAMAAAEVGDSMFGEDPTVNRLQDAVCELLGKDGAIFLPSATMANQIAYRVHTRPGDEIVLDRMSHTIHFEGGSPAAISGVMLYPVNGERGIFTAEDVLDSIRPDDIHAPRTRLISVENTHNMGGGAVWPMEKLKAVVDVAKEHGLKVHMDGARLINAVAASGISAHEWAAQTDSVTFCFSKGLGAPVGAAVVGDKEFVKEARRVQKVLGGAMRQAGIIAAGALYALEHNINRLSEDHANARLIADRLANEDGIEINPESVQTNIIFFNVSRSGMTSREFADRLLEYGVRLGAYKDDRVRAITHMGISRADAETTADAVHNLLQDAKRQTTVQLTGAN